MASHSLWCQMGLGWGVSDEDDIDAKDRHLECSGECRLVCV